MRVEAHTEMSTEMHAKATAEAHAKASAKASTEASTEVHTETHVEAHVEIYTDGSSTNKQGVNSDAGAAFYIPSLDLLRAKHIRGTNSIAEIIAIDYALWYCIEKLSIKNVIILSDSEYAIGVLSGQKKARLYEELIGVVKSKIDKMDSVKFKHVDGHSGIKYNEMVDKAAKAAAKKSK